MRSVRRDCGPVRAGIKCPAESGHGADQPPQKRPQRTSCLCWMDIERTGALDLPGRERTRATFGEGSYYVGVWGGIQI